MFKITYKIVDAHSVTYEGEFVTYFRNPKAITHKICSKHPKISLPFKSNKVEVKKV